MGVREIIAARQDSERSLRGTMTGTSLSGINAPAAQMSNVPAPEIDVRGRQYIQENTPIYPQPQQFPVTPPVGPGTRTTEAVRDVRDVLGQATLALVDATIQPAKQVLDFLANLERPQQYAWAAIIKGLEGGNIGEMHEAGASAFLFRDPITGQENYRVDAKMLINAFGQKFFDKADLDSELHWAVKLPLHLGLYVGADPLWMVPGAWAGAILKGAKGSKITKFFNAVQAANKSRFALTMGEDGRLAATAVLNREVRDTLKKLGKRGEVWGDVMAEVPAKLGGTMTAEEIEAANHMITGMASRNALAARMLAAKKSGEISAEEYGRLMNDIVGGNIDRADVDSIANAVARLVGHMRGQPSTTTQMIKRLKVGPKGAYEAFDLYDGPVDFVAGQLINRFGLMPTDVYFGGLAKRAKDVIKAEAEPQLVKGLLESLNVEEFAGIWNGLSQKAKIKALEKGRHLTKTGRVSKVKEKASDLVSRLVEDEKSALKIWGQLSKAERNNVLREAIRAKSAYDPLHIAKLAKGTEGEGLLARIIDKADEGLPANVSDAFRQARRRAWWAGPYAQDAAAGELLRQRFLKLDIASQAAFELSEVAGGWKSLEAASEVPAELANAGVMRSLLDSGDWATKTWHILHWFIDPQVAFPRPVYGALKLAEDMMMGESNLVSRMLEEHLNVGGKWLKEGGELDVLLGKALDNDADALRAIKDFDDKGEAFKLYGMLRAYYDGMAMRLTRAGHLDFKVGEAVSDYFPRIYKNFVEGIRSAIDLGVLKADEGEKIIQNFMKQKNKRWDALIGPMELDFVKANRTYFRHLLPRNLPKGIMEQEWSAIGALRAYNHGALRKLYLEPAIKAVNKAVVNARNTPGALHEYQEVMLGQFMKSVLGIQGRTGKAIDDTIGAMFKFIGRKEPIRPATKASLAITRAFYGGLLGANLGFFLKNLTQGVNTSTRTGLLNTLQGVTMWVDPELRKIRQARNLLADWDAILEGTTFGGKSMGIKWKRVLYAPARSSELINRGTAFHAGISQRIKELKKAGKLDRKISLHEIVEKHPEQWKEIVNYGHNIANETQFIYGVAGRSPMAGTSVGRLGLQFFSWPIKQMQFLGEGTWGRGARDYQFIFNHILLAGLFSKVAAHADVDAREFLGWGFLPGSLSPGFQGITHSITMFSNMSAGRWEEANDDLMKLADVLMNMVPAWNQIEKTFRVMDRIDQGVTRGYRERVGRQTTLETEFGGVMNQTVNPILRAFELPEISGENAVNILGLPSKQATEYRQAMDYANRSSYTLRRRSAHWVDQWIKAIDRGDYVKAHEAYEGALRDGVPLDPQAIDRERKQKVTPALERVVDTIRKSAQYQVQDELQRKYPGAWRSLERIETPVLPPTPTGGEGTRIILPDGSVIEP